MNGVGEYDEREELEEFEIADEDSQCDCRPGKMIVKKIQNVSDIVFGVQEKLKDCEFKSLLDATAGVYQECSKAQHIHNQELFYEHKYAKSASELAVRMAIALVLRDEDDWQLLTIRTVKTRVAQMCGDNVHFSVIDQADFKVLMKTEIAKLRASQREKKKRKRSDGKTGGNVLGSEEGYALFPIRRGSV